MFNVEFLIKYSFAVWIFFIRNLRSQPLLLRLIIIVFLLDVIWNLEYIKYI